MTKINGWAGPGRLLAVVLLMSLGVVAAFGLAPDTTLDDIPTLLVKRDLALPVFDPPSPVTGYWREERIQRGDTLGSVLARLSVTDAPALNFLHVDARARPLYQLKPGKSVRVQTDDDGHLLALAYLTQNGEMLSVRRADNGFSAVSEPPREAVRLEMAEKPLSARRTESISPFWVRYASASRWPSSSV